MNAVPGAGHLPFPAPCPPQAPHPQHRLGNVSAAGHRGHKRDQTGTVAGPLCERCGTEEGAGAENSGGIRLFQRQKRRVKGPRVCLGRRVPLTVPEAAPGAGRAAGCRADGQGRGPGAAPSPAGAEWKREALPPDLYSSPGRCSAASSAGGGGLL